MKIIERMKSCGFRKLAEPHFWLLVLALMLVSAMVPAKADVVDVGTDALQELLADGVPIIDVRRADEWQATGVVDGSELLTFFDDKGRYDAKQWLEELSGRIDTSKPVIIICQVGGRTSIIGKWLGQQIDTVYNVEDGIVQWIKDGKATVAP